jgi:hypothetical protein
LNFQSRSGSPTFARASLIGSLPDCCSSGTPADSSTTFGFWAWSVSDGSPAGVAGSVAGVSPSALDGAAASSASSVLDPELQAASAASSDSSNSVERCFIVLPGSFQTLNVRRDRQHIGFREP